MTLKTAQLTIITQLFARQQGPRRRLAKAATVGTRQEHWSTQVPPAAVARQAWRQLQQQGLIDTRGRLTLAGLAVAVALRTRTCRSRREPAQDRKPAAVTSSGSARLLLAA